MSQSEIIQKKLYGTMAEWKDDKKYWSTILKDISFNILFGNLYDKINKKFPSLNMIGPSAPDINGWQELQYIAGFDLPPNVKFDLINPDSIFKRLYYLLGDSNLIAVSEFIKTRKGEYDVLNSINTFLTDKVKEFNIGKGNDPINIFGCNIDTGFINKATYNIGELLIPNYKYPDNINNFNHNDMSLFYYMSLCITSIHFDGDGPKGNYNTLDLDGKTYSSRSEIDISKFIKYEFETKFFQFKKIDDFKEDPVNKKERTPQEQQRLLEEDTQIQKNKFNKRFINFKTNVNVICGDTNITEKKSNLSRDTLGKQIAIGLNAFFNTPNTEWLVLMSSHKIIKNRRGFILKNQQIHKSVERGKEENTEADGTILAIKIYTDRKPIIIENWKNIFYEKSIIDPAAEEFVIYSATGVHPVNDNLKYVPSSSEAFAFQQNPEDSLDKKTSKPIEKVFIDHSVLYSNFRFLLANVNIANIDEENKSSSTLLIVLNLNSMINAGKKNWNLKIKDYVNIVTKFDTVLYNLLRDQMYQKINETTFNEYKAEYDQFNGTDKTLHYVKNLSPSELETLNMKVKSRFNITTEEIKDLYLKLFKEYDIEHSATKYLTKGYYEKYIKYKTKYHNLKNTIE